MKKRALAILAAILAGVILTAADCDGTSISSYGCSLVRSQASNPGSWYAPAPIAVWFLQPSGLSVSVRSQQSCWPIGQGEGP